MKKTDVYGFAVQWLGMSADVLMCITSPKAVHAVCAAGLCRLLANARLQQPTAPDKQTQCDTGSAATLENLYTRTPTPAGALGHLHDRRLCMQHYLQLASTCHFSCCMLYCT
jgi:hypothetical protein